MELTLTGPLANRLYDLAKDDPDLARALAQQFIDQVEPSALYGYLLDHETIISLLTTMLQQNPEQTLTDLQLLAAGKKATAPSAAKIHAPAAAPARTKAKPQARKTKAKAKPAAKKAKAQSGGRRRFTKDDVEAIKDKLSAFLQTEGWVTRRQLESVVEIPTQALYRRVIGEMREEGRIVSKGQKAKTVYSAPGTADDADGSVKPIVRRKRGKAKGSN